MYLVVEGSQVSSIVHKQLSALPLPEMHVSELV